VKTYASPKRGSGNGDDASGESFDEAMTELMQQVARMRAANGGSTQADTLLGRSGFSSADVDDPCLDYSSAWDYLHVMADIAADGRRSAEQLWFEDLREIWVILFEDLRSGVDEGIYSVKGRNLDTQDAVDVVVAFEGRDDAARAACLIEGVMSLKPRPYGMPPRELVQFVEENGYALHVVPLGASFVPPDSNVAQTDFERIQNLRQGKFTVLSEEPTLGDERDEGEMGRSL